MKHVLSQRVRVVARFGGRFFHFSGVLTFLCCLGHRKELLNIEFNTRPLYCLQQVLFAVHQGQIFDSGPCTYNTCHYQITGGLFLWQTSDFDYPTDQLDQHLFREQPKKDKKRQTGSEKVCFPWAIARAEREQQWGEPLSSASSTLLHCSLRVLLHKPSLSIHLCLPVQASIRRKQRRTLVKSQKIISGPSSGPAQQSLQKHLVFHMWWKSLVHWKPARTAFWLLEITSKMPGSKLQIFSWISLSKNVEFTTAQAGDNSLLNPLPNLYGHAYLLATAIFNKTSPI